MTSKSYWVVITLNTVGLRLYKKFKNKTFMRKMKSCLFVFQLKKINENITANDVRNLLTNHKTISRTCYSLPVLILI